MDGEPRFVMLETIREYAQERLLAGGEWTAIRRKHAETFLALAEATAVALEGGEQAVWLRRLQQEHDNLRAALDWAVETQEAAIGLRLAIALRLFWFMRGYLTEGRSEWRGFSRSAVERARSTLDCAGFGSLSGDYPAAPHDRRAWRSGGASRIARHRRCAEQPGLCGLHQGENPPRARCTNVWLCITNWAIPCRADCLSHLGTAAFYQGIMPARRL
jgi:hypothetical protein